VFAGELLAIVGPNGAGKSTLLMTIAGGLRPRAGSVRFDGRDITRAAAEDVARARLSLVPEGRHIFGRLTVEENLRVVPLGSRSERRRQLETVYELFPVLGEKRRRIAGHLSGGQQQQLAIARALLARPRLLLLDEPSLGLAPSVVEDLWSSLRLIRERGETIFLVEQRAEITFVLDDRTQIVANGEMRGTLRPQEANDLDRITDAYFGADGGKSA
jgi:branched-chain amino acid transport system ATP-binding protein